MAFRVIICAAVVLVVATVSVEGKADGAPVSETICSTLTPKHGPTTPQTGAPPYDSNVNSVNVSPGEQVTVTVSQQPGGPAIKGFMFQARKVGGTKPEGKWAPVQGESKGMKCDGQENSSLTHAHNNERNKVEAVWIPAGAGTYEILQTFVQDGGTYWVNQKSQKITVA